MNRTTSLGEFLE
jgi:UbiD family decarboxylase